MFIIPNSIAPLECQALAERLEQHWQASKARGIEATGFDNGARTVSITNEALCDRVKCLIESQIRVRLTLSSAELSIWPTVSPGSPLHKHDWNGRESTDYNSVLYLNEDFAGGQFYTDTGITVKPKTGTLTFFDGQNIMHGVRPTLKNNRCTVIFWWHKTVWY
jgi:hypothetical protein